MKTYNFLKINVVFGPYCHFFRRCKKHFVLNKLYLLALLAIITLALPATMKAQAPNISYGSPQVYNKDLTISSLTPINTGGAVIPTTVTTFAGSTISGSSNGTGTSASFNCPLGVCSDGTNLYVADGLNHMIRKIVLSTAIVSTLAGSTTPGSSDGTGTSASFFSPSGVCTDGINLYVADLFNNMIRKIVLSTGVVSTLAGSTTLGSFDGTGTSASFNKPSGICTDGTNLYVADEGNNMIRKIVLSTGVVSTLAGSTTLGSSDGIGTSASFNQPAGVCTDGINLYVSDNQNNRIRRIVLSTGVVSTLAGSGYGSSNGTGTSARFSSPRGVCTDGTNLYVVDEDNDMIRKIVLSTGVVSTVAGVGVSTVGVVNGTGTSARFHVPSGVCSNGTNLYVAEQGNNVIREIILQPGSYSISPALPAGLSIDASTGIISGTPTTITAASNYVVTATNSGGSSTATINIAVNASVPVISYSTPQAYTKGTAIASLTPTSMGGTVLS